MDFRFVLEDGNILRGVMNSWTMMYWFVTDIAEYLDYQNASQLAKRFKAEKMEKVIQVDHHSHFNPRMLKMYVFSKEQLNRVLKYAYYRNYRNHGKRLMDIMIRLYEGKILAKGNTIQLADRDTSQLTLNTWKNQEASRLTNPTCSLEASLQRDINYSAMPIYSPMSDDEETLDCEPGCSHGLP